MCVDKYTLKNTCERVISGLIQTQDYRERVVSGYRLKITERELYLDTDFKYYWSKGFVTCIEY